jgi:FtsP/CotA-like multicopper oxidase with cupredoxin domain
MLDSHMCVTCVCEVQGLRPVDKEYYVMQAEVYAESSGNSMDRDVLAPSYTLGLAETPSIVVLNGREGALTDKPLTAKQGETVRLYFGNAGPNLTSAFHTIGMIIDRVYRDADLLSPPGRGIATVSVPPGGATVVEMECRVPGSYTLVDHAIFRLDKGCVGFLKVHGKDPRRDLYASKDMPVSCPGCKLHN